MRRIVSLWLPHFPIERLIRAARRHGKPPPMGPGQPLALVESGAHGLRLAACDERARARGLRPGERLADARARAPDLASRPHEPDKDAALLLKLVRWSERWSPCIAPDPPDGLLLDVTGIPHLFGGEAALLSDLAAKFRRLGFTVRLGLAGTAAAAWAVARYAESPPLEKGRVREGIDPHPRGQSLPAAINPQPALRADPGSSPGQALPLSGGGDGGFAEAPLPWIGDRGDSLDAPAPPFPIVPPGGEREALAALPVAALGLDAETCATLRRLGLKRIGQLYDVPRASLARRFHGDAAMPLLVRLDQAVGVAETPLTPLGPPPVFAARRTVVEPLVTPEAVTALTEHLVRAFCAGLEEAGHGARRLLLKLYRVDGSRAVVPAGLVEGSHAPDHLMRLITPKLEAVDLGFGVEAATIEAVETAPVAPAQGDFLGRRPAASTLSQLADRILNRYERLALARLRPVESHIPERAETAAPLSSPTLPPPQPSPTRGEGAQAAPALELPSPLWGGDGGGGSADLSTFSPARPLLLLDRPEPVTAIAAVPDGPPVRFTWRRLARRVVRSQGPERIEPEWWRDGSAARSRDYYVVEDASGRRYWLYREGRYGEDGKPQPAWFIHGLFA